MSKYNERVSNATEMHALQQDVLKRIWIVTGAEDIVEFPIQEEFVQ